MQLKVSLLSVETVGSLLERLAQTLPAAVALYDGAVLLKKEFAVEDLFLRREPRLFVAQAADDEPDEGKPSSDPSLGLSAHHPCSLLQWR